MKTKTRIQNQYKVKMYLIDSEVRYELLTHIRSIIDNKYFYIEKGFKTDFASVPKILRPFVPNIFIYNTVSIVHDYLYYKKTISRKEADLILLKGIKSLNCNCKILKYIYGYLFYYTVRLFGQFRWNSNKNQNTI